LFYFSPPLFFIALVKSGQYGGDAANQKRGGLYQRGAGQGAGGSQAQLAAVGTPADPLAPPPPEPRPQPSQSQQSQQPAAAAAATTTAAAATQAGREHEATAGCDQHSDHRGAARFRDAVRPSLAMLTFHG